MKERPGRPNCTKVLVSERMLWKSAPACVLQTMEHLDALHGEKPHVRGSSRQKAAQHSSQRDGMPDHLPWSRSARGRAARNRCSLLPCLATTSATHWNLQHAPASTLAPLLHIRAVYGRDQPPLFFLPIQSHILIGRMVQ